MQKFEATTSADSKENLVNEDLNNAFSRAINAMVMMELQENDALERLNRESQGAVLIGYTVIIKCFDEIIARK